MPDGKKEFHPSQVLENSGDTAHSPVVSTDKTSSNSLYCFNLGYVGPVLLDFSLNVKAATLIFISGCGSAISSAKEGKSGFIYNLVKS